MMIRQPDWVSATMIDQAQTAAEKKLLPAGPLVRCETFDEGLSVQTLHVGSYDSEGPLIADLHHSYLPTNDLTPRGRHHEIYLNDPRRTEPAKLRVVLRQPVTRGE